MKPPILLFNPFNLPLHQLKIERFAPGSAKLRSLLFHSTVIALTTLTTPMVGAQSRSTQTPGVTRSNFDLDLSGEIRRAGEFSEATLLDSRSGSSIYIRQTGSSNSASARQVGSRNRIVQIQEGEGNSSAADQDGIENELYVYQNGFGNVAYQQQLGNGNLIELRQRGNYNQSNDIQEGDNNVLIKEQIGDGIANSVEQRGDGLQLVITTDAGN